MGRPSQSTGSPMTQLTMPFCGSSSSFQHSAATIGVIIMGTMSAVRNTPMKGRSVFSSRAMPSPAVSSTATTASV